MDPNEEALCQVVFSVVNMLMSSVVEEREGDSSNLMKTSSFVLNKGVVSVSIKEEVEVEGVHDDKLEEGNHSGAEALIEEPEDTEVEGASVGSCV